ncbi:hypothetical protein NDU88_003819, partial [Pleurodeles waltl]
MVEARTPNEALATEEQKEDQCRHMKEKYFLSGRNDLERNPHKCHTSTLQTPNGKETAQNIPREELTYLIMSLLQAWKKPLSQFHQNIENYQEISETGQSKAQEISSMMRELEKGVEKVTAKMQSMGIINNLLHGRTSSSDSAGLPSTNDSAMNDYELLLCFRRDTNKVQSYLNILKCRAKDLAGATVSSVAKYEHFNLPTKSEF